MCLLIIICTYGSVPGNAYGRLNITQNLVRMGAYLGKLIANVCIEAATLTPEWQYMGSGCLPGTLRYDIVRK